MLAFIFDPMMWDPLYWVLTIPALLFSLWAQMRVKRTFKKYSTVGVRSGMTGAQAAAAIVRASGLSNVTIERHGLLQVDRLLHDFFPEEHRAVRYA